MKNIFSKFLALFKQQEFARTHASLFIPEKHSDKSQSGMPTANLLILLIPVGTVAKRLRSLG